MPGASAGSRIVQRVRRLGWPSARSSPPVDVLVRLGWLPPSPVNEWRLERVAYAGVVVEAMRPARRATRIGLKRVGARLAKRLRALLRRRRCSRPPTPDPGLLQALPEVAPRDTREVRASAGDARTAPTAAAHILARRDKHYGDRPAGWMRRSAPSPTAECQE
jgi:hypothetical protein